mgnify:CR=1 FL=1
MADKKTLKEKVKSTYKKVKDIAATGALGTGGEGWKKKKKKDYVTGPDATFGGKRIQIKDGPELKPFKIKQEPLAKNIRPKGLGHKAGGRIGLKRGSGRGGRMKDLPDHLRHSLVNQAKHKATHKSGGRTGLKHGGSVGAAIRGRGAEIK